MKHRTLHLIAMTLFAIGALSVGCFERPLVAVLGYETNDQNCGDGIDNDQDGLIDCADVDCIFSSTLCGEYVPSIPYLEPENTVETCHDHIDNDDDGTFDCGDEDCRNILETCCLVETTEATCSDGIDNDGNGFADCDEFSCDLSFQTVDQKKFITACETPTTDDNTDDNTDTPDPNRTPSDETTLTACKDGIDNDQNGYTDCEDFSCAKSRDATVVAYCESLPKENTLDACKNKIDDDNNGYTDCEDFSCRNHADLAVRQACQESVGLTIAEVNQKCSDTIDNDQDGFIDCADWDCSWNPDVTVCKGSRVCETTF